jgi:hypothetical protein
MSVFNVSIDLSDLHGMADNVGKNLQELANRTQQQLAIQTYGKAIELASERLHSRREMFVENWSMEEKDGAVLLTLKAQAVWIDEGLKPGYLFPALMNGPNAKTLPNGTTINIVPFKTKVGSGPTNLTSYANDIAEAVKQEFKKRKIPWDKIQRDSNGRPLLGNIAKIRGLQTPIKTHEGPGMGQGSIGEPRKGHTGIEFLKGANLYQFATKDKAGKDSVERGVITYRTASSKHPEKFQHPGLERTDIIEDTYEWALDTLEKEILPKLFKELM